MEDLDVAANVSTKLFSCGSNVPNMKLCSALLWLRTKEEVMGVKTYVVAEQDNEVSVFN